MTRVDKVTVGAVIVLLGLGAGYVTQHPPGPRTLRNSSIPQAAVPQSVRPERLDPQFMQDASAALEALNDLHSAIKVGVLYTDYVKRVADTNVVVDRFLRTWSSSPNANHTRARGVLNDISSAMTYYSKATGAWESDIRSESDEGHELYKRQIQDYWKAAGIDIERARQALSQ